jgi:hypothetical protein
MVFALGWGGDLILHFTAIMSNQLSLQNILRLVVFSHGLQFLFNTNLDKSLIILAD